ncbi:MAG TPA: ATP-binding cassette domain-containing protein [Turneriella sp.]|nr:ATP-binding cassette domain-containing protein [Turneriella sp.]
MIAEVVGVTIARSGITVLEDVTLRIEAGQRILLTGENGSGKSSLLMLLAAKLYPYNNAGERRYAWDSHADFRAARRYTALVSREEQLRLRQIHSASTVHEFLLGHADGEDFLYRENTPAEAKYIGRLLSDWQIWHLADRKIRTLSLGELRLVQVVRAAMHPRRLYLLDEIFSSLSDEIARRVSDWIESLPDSAAVVLTSHDEEIRRRFAPTRILHVADRRVSEVETDSPVGMQQVTKPRLGQQVQGVELIHAQAADFFHDFNPVLSGISFSIRTGQRVLVTGSNGSGKTTLLRVLHGDFYPAYGCGDLQFRGELAHEQKRDLWKKVQFIAAAHFDYFLPGMSVEDVLASRLSGSLYDYDPVLPDAALQVAEQFGLLQFLPRPFARLSEGEKTRVLLCRAFLAPAPVYLIDEGFMALSGRYFELVTQYLNALPAEAVTVIAANERISALQARLEFPLLHWQMERGRLTILP